MSVSPSVADVYHEAGHAVLGALVGLLGDRTTVRSPRGCRTDVRPLTDRDDLERSLGDLLLMAGAGWAAEWSRAERVDDPGGQLASAQSNHEDEEEVRRWLRVLGESGRTAEHRLDGAAKKVYEDWFRRPGVWSAVEEVAKALLLAGNEGLRRAEIQALVAKHYPKARSTP